MGHRGRLPVTSVVLSSRADVRRKREELRVGEDEIVQTASTSARVAPRLPTAAAATPRPAVRQVASSRCSRRARQHSYSTRL